jgi:TonB family protein
VTEEVIVEKNIVSRAAPVTIVAVGLAACLGMTAPVAMAESYSPPPRIDMSYPHYQPPYPDNAQVSGEQGTVTVNVLVSSGGRVRNVAVAGTSGFADLDNAAVEGVLGWHFIPAVRGGDTVTAWTQVKIVFQLPTAAATMPVSAPAPSH